MLVSTTRHELKGRDRWKGLSGGPLLANGLVVGVMREVPEHYDDDPVAAEPLALCLRGTDGDVLARLLGIDRPLDDPSDPGQITLFKAYELVGEEASAASERTFRTALGQPIYGRDADMCALQAALDAHDRGVLLLQGEAGLGKSRLAAAWADRLERQGVAKVLRHAFSVRETLSATRSAMVDNLVRQAADMLGPAALGGGAPRDAPLADRLARLLHADRQDGRRLVVVVDALDEAGGTIDPWRHPLGKGVYVLATCRVTSGDPPRIFEIWHRWASEAGQLILVQPLAPLDKSAVAEWYSSVAGSTGTGVDTEVSRIIDAAEGIPLFTKYVIEDHLAGLASPSSSGFLAYARERLEEMRDRLIQGESRWSWAEAKKMLTLLVLAKVPIPETALEDLVTRNLLDELDLRVLRWLLRENSQVSFAHPRLASVFGTALPTLNPDLAGKMRDTLLQSCMAAWAVFKGENTSAPLLPYALAWLPAHLMDAGRMQDAAALLGDARFVQARLRASTNAETAHRTASETFRVQAHVGENHPASAWRRFWIEAESRVALAIRSARNWDADTADLFARLALDRLGADSPATAGLRVEPDAIRLAEPCGFQHPNLRRSLEFLHSPGVSNITGVCRAGDQLVSWGTDGVIRRLSLAGEPLPYGETRVHGGKVSGALVLADGLVSWGTDGAVRFFDRGGRARAVRPDLLHAGGVAGVQSIEGGVASWDKTGAVRCWSEQGDHLFDWPTPGNVVEGALVKGQKLITWDRQSVRTSDRDGRVTDCQHWDKWWHGVDAMIDGGDRLFGYGLHALRVWNREGGLIGGGPTDARINGVILLDHALVSRNTEGSVMFWTLDGRRREGGSDKAHAVSVQGVLRLDDGIVSWSHDGLLRFWSNEGEPRSGRSPRALHAHMHGLAIDGDSLVSWGDRDIRFWSHQGEPLPGGVRKAHEGIMHGVLPLDDGYLSWGAEGAVRLWSKEVRRPFSESEEAHEAWVTDLAVTPAAIVSRGFDGKVRFWSKTGDLLPHAGKRDHPHHVRALLAHPEGVVSQGYDGTVRCWTEKGAPLDDNHEHFERLRAWIENEPAFAAQGGRVASALLGGQAEGVVAVPGGSVCWTSREIFHRASGQNLWRSIVTSDDFIQEVRCVASTLVLQIIKGRIELRSMAGDLLDGSDLASHEENVRDILVLSDRLVSWNEEGALRFWTHEGASAAGGSPRAHEDGMKAALAFADTVVTVGKSGDLRRWDGHGLPIGSGWIAPGELEVCKVLGDEIWVYLLGRPRRLLPGK